MTRSEIVQLLLEERDKQDNKWGADRNLPELLWQCILSEETGEVANAVLELKHKVTGLEDLKKELVQVAAVCMAWLEMYDAS